MEDEAEEALKESLDEQQGEQEEESQETMPDEELEDVLGGDDTEQSDTDENELFPNMIAKKVGFNIEHKNILF